MKASIQPIVEEVAKVFGVRPAEIYTRARHEPVATARLVAISLCADELGSRNAELGIREPVAMNISALAREFKRTHSMVSHARHKVADRQSVDPKFAALIARARREIALRTAAEPVHRSDR